MCQIIQHRLECILPAVCFPLVAEEAVLCGLGGVNSEGQTDTTWIHRFVLCGWLSSGLTLETQASSDELRTLRHWFAVLVRSFDNGY